MGGWGEACRVVGACTITLIHAMGQAVGAASLSMAPWHTPDLAGLLGSCNMVEPVDQQLDLNAPDQLWHNSKL